MVYLFNVSFICTYNPIFVIDKYVLFLKVDIDEILLKLALNTNSSINQSIPCLWWQYAVVKQILTWRKNSKFKDTLYRKI
jgi:hypothetical protein